MRFRPQHSLLPGNFQEVLSLDYPSRTPDMGTLALPSTLLSRFNGLETAGNSASMGTLTVIYELLADGVSLRVGGRASNPCIPPF